MNRRLEKIKKYILGTQYDLSVVFASAKKMKMLNTQYRAQHKPTNVLSFRLTDSIGEVFLCPELLDKEASKHNLDTDDYTAYTFIHSLLHLKGYEHCKEMERLEKKYLQKFNVHIFF